MRMPRSLPSVARRSWAPVRPKLLLALPILSALAAAGFGVAAWRAERANAVIAALEAGEDAEIGPDAPAPVLVARVRFLAQRDRLGETAPGGGARPGGRPRSRRPRALSRRQRAGARRLHTHHPQRA